VLIFFDLNFYYYIFILCIYTYISYKIINFTVNKYREYLLVNKTKEIKSYEGRALEVRAQMRCLEERIKRYRYVRSHKDMNDFNRYEMLKKTHNGLLSTIRRLNSEKDILKRNTS